MSKLILNQIGKLLFRHCGSFPIYEVFVCLHPAFRNKSVCTSCNHPIRKLRCFQRFTASLDEIFLCDAKMAIPFSVC